MTMKLTVINTDKKRDAEIKYVSDNGDVQSKEPLGAGEYKDIYIYVGIRAEISEVNHRN